MPIHTYAGRMYMYLPSYVYVYYYRYVTAISSFPAKTTKSWRRCNGIFVWTLLFVVDCHFIAGCCISNELLNWVDSQIVAPLFLWLWPSTGRQRNPSPQYFYFRRSRPLNEDKIEVNNNNISILEQKNNSSQWATCLWALVILPNDIISLRKIDVIWWSALNAIRM